MRWLGSLIIAIIILVWAWPVVFLFICILDKILWFLPTWFCLIIVIIFLLHNIMKLL